MKTFADIERQAIVKAWIDKGFELTPLPHTRTPTRPHKTLMQGFDYVPSTKTDITLTWRKAGWKPIERKAPNDIQANPDSPT